MDIKELAKETIVALNIVPAGDVWIDVNTPDWDGSKPLVIVTSDASKPEDETQFGAITETTIMGVHVFAATREQATDLKKKVADAVYVKFEALEPQRGSGILCIIVIEHNTEQYQNTETFRSYTKFQILHSPTH
ncbi:MAG: hypothetical protein FWE95_05305 [Planctomycetaceae bacterium]|nr:hypothetical protein [Planctomycetaceae bacterium]